MKSKPVPPDYWPCACVKRDRAGNLKALKLNPPLVKYCRTCGCVRPPKSAAEAERATEHIGAMPEQRQVMPRVHGKPFRCECGCNVFSETGPSRLRCNSCQAAYTTEPAVPATGRAAEAERLASE